MLKTRSMLIHLPPYLHCSSPGNQAGILDQHGHSGGDQVGETIRSFAALFADYFLQLRKRGRSRLSDRRVILEHHTTKKNACFVRATVVRVHVIANVASISLTSGRSQDLQELRDKEWDENPADR